jgi:dTDP-D-glucose 4,6-dehydratase
MDINKNIEELCEYVEDRAFNDFRYCIDSSKLENLGWKKEVNFIDGLLRTIKWYSNNEI